MIVRYLDPQGLLRLISTGNQFSSIARTLVMAVTQGLVRDGVKRILALINIYPKGPRTQLRGF